MLIKVYLFTGEKRASFNPLTYIILGPAMIMQKTGQNLVLDNNKHSYKLRISDDEDFRKLQFSLCPTIHCLDSMQSKALKEKWDF